MASDNTCPICGFHLIRTETAKCPQCDADLACFTVLDSIPDEVPVVSDIGGRRAEDGGRRREKRSSGKWMLPGAVFLLLMGWVSGLWIAQTDQFEPPSPEVLRRLPMGIKIPVKKPLSYAPLDPSAFDSLGFISEGAEKNQVEPSDFKEPSKPLEKVETYSAYEVGENETLWRIAEKCYGSGFYFPVLMELNPGLGVYNLEKGERLKIFKDADRAEQLYHQIIHVAGKRVWYGYRVIKGDSFKGITAKLYGSEGTAKRIMRDNPHASFQPGERIRVELE